MIEKKRNSNIELLRFISIFMIVIGHYFVHGGINTYNLPLGLNRFLIEFLSLGNYGTVLFVLISGYYLINTNEIKLKKFIRLLFQTVFYSVIIYLILVFINLESFSILEFGKNCLPITFQLYWFATVYIILYLFSPFINKLLHGLTKKEYLLFLGLLFIIFSVLQTFTNQTYFCSEIIEFVMYYSIGGYLAKYPNNLLKKYNLKICFLSIIIIALSVICIDIFIVKTGHMAIGPRILINRTSPFVILFCIGLFDYFSRKKSFSNKYINKISPLVFGIYLISDNNYIREILWKDIFKNSNYSLSNYILLHMLFAVCSTVIICLIIEYFRKNFVEKPLFKLLDSKLDLCQTKFKKYINNKIEDK